MAHHPAETVTLLLTDIAGSTRLWQQHPQAMPKALARHDMLLRQAIEAEGGLVVKHTGDGVLAVFRSAHAALGAALSAQTALGEQICEEIRMLGVRMAVHTGEPHQRDGDYFGPTLNLCARLLTVAQPGQVVVSLATEEVIGSDWPLSATLEDLGEHHLPDIDRPEHLFLLSA